VEDARRHGITIRPIDVLKSDWECTLEPEGDDGFAIRMGLRYVKGLGEGDWERIRLARERRGNDRQAVDRSTGIFSLETFVHNTRLDEGALTALARSGALGTSRRSSLWRVAGVLSDSGPALGLEDTEELPEFPELNAFEEITWDYDSSQHSTRGHPLEPYRTELKERGLPDAAALVSAEDGSRVSYAGLVICRQRPGTANGVVFMTLEDESGFVNLVVWTKVFQKFRKVILTSSFLGVTGKVQSRDGIVHLIVENCWKPDLSQAVPRTASHDFH
jgi:error-prone DNA polymerase